MMLVIFFHRKIESCLASVYLTKRFISVSASGYNSLVKVDVDLI